MPCGLNCTLSCNAGVETTCVSDSKSLNAFLVSSSFSASSSSSVISSGLACLTISHALDFVLGDAAISADALDSSNKSCIGFEVTLFWTFDNASSCALRILFSSSATLSSCSASFFDRLSASINKSLSARVDATRSFCLCASSISSSCIRLVATCTWVL